MCVPLEKSFLPLIVCKNASILRHQGKKNKTQKQKKNLWNLHRSDSSLAASVQTTVYNKSWDDTENASFRKEAKKKKNKLPVRNKLWSEGLN